ncbi:MAG: glycosyltransferase [Saprospiraceae bacterium]|nr:glycosyltransferase [Pyrinomonadaceae bacterium]
MTTKKLTSFHITNYYHKDSGGISTVYNHLLEAANRHQRKVRLIVPGERDEQEEVGEFGRIYFVKANRSPLFDRRYRVIMPWQYLPERTRMRQILCEEMPDIIEVADKYTLSYLAGHIKRGFLKPLNRPMTVHLSCERLDDNMRAWVSGIVPIRWFSRGMIGNYVAPMFDYHLANSDYTADELLKAVSAGRNDMGSKPVQKLSWSYFRSLSEGFSERVSVSNCGVDSDHFNPGRKDVEIRRQIMDEAGFPENATVLFYAGRLSPEKNIALLPKILGSLISFYNHDPGKREYRLLVAGGGPRSEWLEKELEKTAPGKFKLLGHVGDPEKLANLYANADIFLHPNPREPFGIGPLEAMASGTPVIAPNSGGVLSYANEENAWLREAEPDDYFAAIMDVINNPEKRDEKVKRALETAGLFSWKNATDRLFQLYDELYEKFSHERFSSSRENIENDKIGEIPAARI